MKKIIIILFLTLSFFGCEKIGRDESECYKIFSKNAHVIKNMLNDEKIDSTTYFNMIKEYEIEYEDCKNF